MKVSIIIPFCRETSVLSECLKSIEYQTYSDLEVVLVSDDASDEALAVASSYFCSKRKVLVHLDENCGPGVARNLGLSKSSGELCVFLDADDMLVPDAIECIVDNFEKHNVEVLTYKCSFMGERIVETTYKRSCIISNAPMTLHNYFDQCVLNREYAPIVWLHAFRRKFLVDNSLTFPSLRYFEDNYFMFKACQASGTIAMIDRCLVVHREHDASIMGSKMNAEKYRSLISNAELFSKELNSRNSIRVLASIYIAMPMEIILSLHAPKKDFFLLNWKYVCILGSAIFYLHSVFYIMLGHFISKKIRGILK